MADKNIELLDLIFSKCALETLHLIRRQIEATTSELLDFGLNGKTAWVTQAQAKATVQRHIDAVSQGGPQHAQSLILGSRFHAH